MSCCTSVATCAFRQRNKGTVAIVFGIAPAHLPHRTKLEPRAMSDDAYTPPAIWTWDKESGGRFAAINRPVAGATHDKALPVGKHPLQLYSMGTPMG